MVVGAITALTSGWDRLVSPLTYQDVRGLQIESILATPLIVAAAFFPGHWHIDKAPSKSFEIFGPGVDQLVTASSVLMACTMLFGLAWALWHFLGDAWSPRSTALFFLTMVLLLIVSNKVFSPQYVVWFGPLLAVLVAKQPEEPGASAQAGTSSEADALRKLTWLSVLVAALTTAVFPFTYNLLFEGPHWFAALVLTARNILMVYITYLALKATIHAGLKSQAAKKREAGGVIKKEPLKEKA